MWIAYFAGGISTNSGMARLWLKHLNLRKSQNLRFFFPIMYKQNKTLVHIIITHAWTIMTKKYRRFKQVRTMFNHYEQCYWIFKTK